MDDEDWSAPCEYGTSRASVVGRRTFLTALGAGSVAALVASIESARGEPRHRVAPQRRASVSRRVKVPPGRSISTLPGHGRHLALTIDDGTSSAVVGAYVDFVRSSGIRLTFFPNGVNPSWTEHAPALRPLIESGQVQLGNHTWSHQNLTTLSDAQVAREITRNDAFFVKTFGVSGRPYLRPPYGAHDARVDRIAAELGYSTITMWWGSLGDSSVLTADQIMANAREWFRPQRIVIGHANHPGVTHAYDRLAALLRERRLHTVTLDDVFSRR